MIETTEKYIGLPFASIINVAENIPAVRLAVTKAFLMWDMDGVLFADANWLTGSELENLVRKSLHKNPFASRESIYQDLMVVESREKTIPQIYPSRPYLGSMINYFNHYGLYSLGVCTRRGIESASAISRAFENHFDFPGLPVCALGNTEFSKADVLDATSKVLLARCTDLGLKLPPIYLIDDNPAEVDSVNAASSPSFAAVLHKGDFFDSLLSVSMKIEV